MRRHWLVVAVPLALLMGIASGCGSSHKASTSPSTTSALAAPLAPEKPGPAPAFTLDNQFGKPISLSRYRGKAVLLTFLYVHCPDVCPLITAGTAVVENVSPTVSFQAAPGTVTENGTVTITGTALASASMVKFGTGVTP